MPSVGEYGAILTLKDNFSGTADKASSKIGGFGKLGSIAGAGLKIAAVGLAAVGTAAAISLKGFSDFESEMLTLKAVASDDLGFGDYDKMYKQAKDLGAATQFSAKEVAAGMGELAKAGLKPQQVMESIAGTLDMAAAEGIEVARAAEITANALSQFNLQASETSRIADVMAKASNLGTLGMEDMAESFTYVGSIAGQMANQSLESVSAALVALSNNGIKGSQAGTALRATLARLSAPTGSTQKMLDKLGMTVTDTEGNMLGLSEIVGQFTVATEKMGDAEKAAAAKMLVGETAMSGFLALAKTGQPALESMTEELENATGAAEAMAKIKMSGLAGAWELMSGAIDGVVISLGERLAPLLGGITDKIGKLADKANGLFALGDAVNYIGTDAKGFSNTLGISKKKEKKIDPMVSKVDNFAGMAANKAEITSNLSVGNVLPVTKEQIEGVYSAYSSFNELTGLNLGVDQFMSLSEKLGEVKDSFTGLWDTMTTGFSTAVQPLMQALGLEGASNLDILNAGLEGLKAVFDGIGAVVTFLTPIFQTLVEVILNIAEPIITMLTPSFQNLMVSIQQATPLWSALGTVLKVIGSILGFVIGSVLKMTIDAITTLINIVSGAIEIFYNFIAPTDAAKAALSSVGDVILKVVGYIKDLITGVKSIDFSNIKVPSFGGLFGGAKKFSGASYIMKDEQPALLHRGEAVLTRDENKRFRKMNAENNVPSMGSNLNVSPRRTENNSRSGGVVIQGDIIMQTTLDKGSIMKCVDEFMLSVNQKLKSEGR